MSLLPVAVPSETSKAAEEGVFAIWRHTEGTVVFQSKMADQGEKRY